MNTTKPVVNLLRKPVMTKVVSVYSSMAPTRNLSRGWTNFSAHLTNCHCCGTLPFLCSRTTPSSPCSSSLSSFRSQRRSLTTDTTLTEDSIEDANPHIRDLLRNNRKWVDQKNQEDPNFFTTLGRGQKPKYLYIGCSDSRVPANEILGLGPGEVFVHRNIGNQVPGNDLNVLSVLEFAVGHLDVTDIIITGHYACGAVKAATSRQDLGTLENWLRLIRDVYRLHKDYLDLINDPDQLHRTLVELNVIEQCLNVFKTGVVQRKRAQTRKELLEAGKSKIEVDNGVYPRIHGLVFNPSEGIVRVLPVNFSQRVGSLDHIYGLYQNVRYKDVAAARNNEEFEHEV